MNLLLLIIHDLLFVVFLFGSICVHFVSHHRIDNINASCLGMLEVFNVDLSDIKLY